jgi:hypothetical protein
VRSLGIESEEPIMKKLIIVASTVVALGIGTVAGSVISTAANPKLTVSCEGNSCSVTLPGAVLNEMNQTMTKTMEEATKSDKADEQAFFKEVDKLFEQPSSQRDATVEDPDAGLVREFKKLFQ